MICPKCNNKLFINEWEGWIWWCPHCDYKGRKATDKEIEEYENDYSVSEKK
jgi:ribosomal protein L37AE/L43A